MRNAGLFMIGLMIGLLSLTSLLSCADKREKMKPGFGDLTESVYAAGIVKSGNQYQVFSTVTGIIDKIYVTENDLVKKGDPLLFVADEASRINSKNAAITSVYAELNSNKEKLKDLENAIELAKSKFINDSLLFRRQLNLWNEGIGTRVELEQKELAGKNSKMALESAAIRYNNLWKELRYNAEQSKNNLAITKSNENNFMIRSEKNGKVYAILKEEGEIINPQVPVAVIGDPAEFLLELQIDEYDIVKIRVDQSVIVTMDSYQKQVFEASVTKINPLMNPNTRTFTIEARFIRQPAVLYPNLTAEANIIIREKKNALIIPRDYLVGDSLVLIGKNKSKPVVTGLKDYRKVEIISGLSPDDIIYKPIQ